jgi:hypothetical protein
MLVAVQALKANQGSRFIQITSNDGWDMHQNIYSAANFARQGKLLDPALSSMLGDLNSNGLLDSTLVVMVGEFGRTVGLGGGHRLNDGQARRPAGSRIPIRSDNGSGAVFSDQRTLGVVARAREGRHVPLRDLMAMAS